MSLAITSINNADNAWRQARKTKPPCPIYTQLALAHYMDAESHIAQRILAMKEHLDEAKT